jgi:hypothetical protein
MEDQKKQAGKRDGGENARKGSGEVGVVVAVEPPPEKPSRKQQEVRRQEEMESRKAVMRTRDPHVGEVCRISRAIRDGPSSRRCARTGADRRTWIRPAQCWCGCGVPTGVARPGAYAPLLVHLYCARVPRATPVLKAALAAARGRADP